jgi:hypothetical protein
MRNYESLNKKRPHIDQAEIWIGQDNTNYGLLVTPRFENGKWENDKSEIRHFKPKYWSIGHIMETGLLIPNIEKKIEFKTVEEYLQFFENVIVRSSGSKYEKEIAAHYSKFVLESNDRLNIPLLIPELRYNGLEKKHKYRLDFTIIDYVELNKVGFELSPWSSHGYLSKTKNLKQSEINDMASDNFEREMRKHKDYFKKYGIFTLIYTDTDLLNTKVIFDDMANYLRPKEFGTQLKYHILNDFFKE